MEDPEPDAPVDRALSRHREAQDTTAAKFEPNDFRALVESYDPEVALAAIGKDAFRNHLNPRKPCVRFTDERKLRYLLHLVKTAVGPSRR